MYNHRMSAIPWVTMLVASVAADYTNPIPQPGEPGYRPTPKHHLRVLFENDSAFDEDCNYSHGTRIDYAQAISENRYYGLSIVQNIYTPEYHTNGNVYGQQPYAGYLALGAAYLQRGENMGNSVELQLGTIGKPSFAENSQWFVHEVAGMEQWDGWGDQLASEMTMQISARQDWRLAFCECQTKAGYETDGIIFTRESLGTVSIAGGVGVGFRWGRNLPDSMQVNGNHAADYSVGLINKPNYRPEETSWFVQAIAYGSYVARDMFIDGGAFHHFDRICSRKPWQAEFQLGVGVVRKGISYYAGGVMHTRRYRTQDKNSMYGTFAISWNW